MNQHFTTELGRMRTEEQIARADRYRLAQQVRKAESNRNHSRLSWSKGLVYRRALAAVGLSTLVLLLSGSVVQAMPIGPDPVGDGVAVDITATKDHGQVKGSNPGQPVRSEHAYMAVSDDPNAEALELRAEYYRQALTRDPNAHALALRAEYYTQQLGIDVSTGAIAQARALNEPSVGAPTGAIAQARALNEPSVGAPIDAVAQARALNVPSTTTTVGVEVADRPESNFPLAESIAVIAGILVLGAGALMVVTRNSQTPTTV